MSRYLLRRLGVALVLLYLVLTTTFFLIQLAPGDPTLVLVGETTEASVQARERLRRAYGLDRPLPVQYLAWLRAIALEGDWGTSFVHKRPVTEVLGRALPATLMLALTATAVQYGLALPLGVAAARRRGSAFDRGVRSVSLLLYSMPLFWMGLMAILLLAHRWPIFPAGHLRSLDSEILGSTARFLDLAHHLALPSLVIGVALTGATLRFVRNQMIEALEADHVRTARAKGLSEGRVIWVHALRSALVPVTQHLGLNLPVLLNGALIIEVVFSLPGLGGITYQSILARDYPVVLASTAFSGALVIAGNLLADLLHMAVDPTVREPALGTGS